MNFIYDAEITVNSVIDNLTEAGLVDGEPEINIYTVDGFLKYKGDSIEITFTELGEGGKTNCDITLIDSEVFLKRRGQSESDMHFKESESFTTIYSVPPYKFDMTYRTNKIRNSIGKDGGELQLIYSMNIGGQEKKVRMKISVKIKR